MTADGPAVTLGSEDRAPRSALAPGHVHVWSILGDAEAVPLAPLAAVLDARERARADRFVFARDRARYILAHAALRHCLAGCLGCSAQTLRFEAGPNGKPALVPRGPSFNLSHSGRAVMIALTQTGLELGIDVEAHRPMPDMAALVAGYFSAAEHAAWSALPAHRRDTAFFDLWTRKEAFVKATGEGLSRALDSFTLSLGQRPAITAPPMPDWSVHDIAPDPEYSAALVVAHPMPRVTVERLSAACVAAAVSFAPVRGVGNPASRLHR